MPTLQDVARRAGVSTATVSKVLSNTPYFTEATRDRVMQAVADLGYRPNLAARALASGKTHIIAVVFPYVYDAIFTDPLVMQILEGIEGALNPHDYNILLSTPRFDAAGPEESYLQMLQSGYVEGLIVIDNVRRVSFAAAALGFDIPTVVLGYHPAPYSVRSDDYAGGRCIMQYLLGHGHRSMGLVTTPQDTHFAVDMRLNGMRDAAEAHGLAFDQLPIAEGDFSTAGGETAARALLRQHPHLTALVCLNDRMAVGAIQAAHDAGRRVPDDISVVGYDNVAAAAVAVPPLTTVDQRAAEQGRRAVDLLLTILNDAEARQAGASQADIIEPVLIERGSSGPPMTASG